MFLLLFQSCLSLLGVSSKTIDEIKTSPTLGSQHDAYRQVQAGLLAFQKDCPKAFDSFVKAVVPYNNGTEYQPKYVQFNNSALVDREYSRAYYTYLLLAYADYNKSMKSDPSVTDFYAVGDKYLQDFLANYQSNFDEQVLARAKQAAAQDYKNKVAVSGLANALSAPSYQYDEKTKSWGTGSEQAFGKALKDMTDKEKQQAYVDIAVADFLKDYNTKIALPYLEKHPYSPDFSIEWETYVILFKFFIETSLSENAGKPLTHLPEFSEQSDYGRERVLKKFYQDRVDYVFLLQPTGENTLYAVHPKLSYGYKIEFIELANQFPSTLKFQSQFWSPEQVATFKKDF
jgi:hypothetical protein